MFFTFILSVFQFFKPGFKNENKMFNGDDEKDEKHQSGENNCAEASQNFKHHNTP